MIKLRAMRGFRLVIGSPLCICLMLSATYGYAGPSPSGVINAFNAALLECMKNAKELGYLGRYKLLEPVIKDSFAMSYMVTVSSGKYWRTLSEKQRHLLQETYTDWSIATYAGRFDDYSGERFEVVSESRPVQGTVTVISKLVSRGGEETDFYYRLRKLEGKWLIVDIQISGVSQLALTRSQFASVLGSKGFDGLISSLKEKIANFSAIKKS